VADAKPRRCAKLFEAMARAPRQGKPAARPLVPPNADWTGRTARRAMRAAEGVAAYRRFLQGARTHKGERGASPPLEREVLAQARQAQGDLRALSAGALRIARHLEATGLLGESFAAVQTALRRAGRVSVRDLFADIVEDETGRQALKDVGLSEATIQALSEIAAETDATIEADDPGLRVRSSQRGRDVRLVSRPRSGPATSPSQLLFGRLFDAAVDGWETPGHFPFDVTEPPPARKGAPATRDVLDVMLASSIGARLEAARHVRKLEDTGLAVHAGREPASLFTGAVVIGTAGAILIAAGGTIKVICAVSTDLGPGDRICQLGDFLIILGAAFLAAAVVLAVIGAIIQSAAAASA
jgi:hypothetical protein